jgi:hypothetical protein
MSQFAHSIHVFNSSVLTNRCDAEHRDGAMNHEKTNNSTASSVDGLAFPAFLFGSFESCFRKMKTEARKWSKAYQETGTFPEPTLASVPRGSIVMCRDIADFYHGPTPWHLYLLEPHVFVFRIWKGLELDRQASNRMLDTFDTFVCHYPWGAQVKHRRLR